MKAQPYDRKERALTVVPEKASTATPAEKHTFPANPRHQEPPLRTKESKKTM